MRATSVNRGAGVLLAALAALGPASSAAESVTVVSWGGSYADACEEAYLKPFAADTGIAVTLDDYSGGLSQIRSQVEAGNVYWDIVDIQFPDLVRGCDEGLFETLDPSLLAPGEDRTVRRPRTTSIPASSANAALACCSSPPWSPTTTS